MRVGGGSGGEGVLTILHQDPPSTYPPFFQYTASPPTSAVPDTPSPDPFCFTSPENKAPVFCWFGGRALEPNYSLGRPVANRQKYISHLNSSFLTGIFVTQVSYFHLLTPETGLFRFMQSAQLLPIHPLSSFRHLVDVSFLCHFLLSWCVRASSLILWVWWGGGWEEEEGLGDRYMLHWKCKAKPSLKMIWLCASKITQNHCYQTDVSYLLANVVKIIFAPVLRSKQHMPPTPQGTEVLKAKGYSPCVRPTESVGTKTPKQHPCIKTHGVPYCREVIAHWDESSLVDFLTPMNTHAYLLIWSERLEEDQPYWE